MEDFIKSLLYPFITPVRDNVKRYQYTREGYEEHPCIVKDAWGQTGIVAFIKQSDNSYKRFKIVIDRGEDQTSCIYLKSEEITEALIYD